MITPSTPLSVERKRIVFEAFERLVRDVGTVELFYIDQSIHRTIGLLSQARTHWLRDLGRHARALYELQSAISVEQRAIDDTFRLTAAALFYLVSHYDQIPDHTVGIGYLDDAYVVNRCLQRLEPKALLQFEEYLARLEDD